MRLPLLHDIVHELQICQKGTVSAAYKPVDCPFISMIRFPLPPVNWHPNTHPVLTHQEESVVCVPEVYRCPLLPDRCPFMHLSWT